MSQGGQTPYLKSIKCKVVAVDKVLQYRNEKQEEKKLLNAAVCDTSLAVKTTVYDETKFGKFEVGKCVILRNIIRKPNAIVVTSATKVFPTSEINNIPEEVEEKGRFIINPPSAPVKAVSDALASPPKVVVSVRGRVVQEEAVREVDVKNTPTKLKNIIIEDETGKCRVALWRDQATMTEYKTGEYIEINDVVTNSYRNEISLSSTYRTRIVKTESPEIIKSVEVMSVCVDDDEFTLLLENDEIIRLKESVVRQCLPEANDLEEEIMALCCPTFHATCTFKGTSVTKLEIN